MRGCRGERLLSSFLICLQLLALTDCGGLLVGARDLPPPSSPPPCAPTASKMDDEMVELLWLSCGLDMRTLEEIKNHFHYTLLIDIVRSSYVTDLRDASPPKTKIEEGSTSTVPPEVRRTFLNCLNRQNFPVRVSSQEDSRNWWSDYLKPLFGSRRRHLAQGPSAMAPTPAPTATPGPAVLSHNAFLAPTPVLGSAKEPIESVLSPALVSPPKKTVSTPKSVPKKKKKSNNSSNTTAVGLSVASVVLLALVCVCCCKCRRNRTSSQYMHRDDKPLLSFNLSDFSGSSRKSYSHGTPIDVNKLGALSLKSEAGQNGHAPSLKLSSNEGLNSSSELSAASANCVPAATPPPPAPPKAPPPPPPRAPEPPPKSGSPPGPAPPPGPKASPPPPPGPKASPPPPPPKSAGPPRPPPPAIPSSSKARPAPPLKKLGKGEELDADSNAAKTKLKPFFWDKVSANPDQSMVWDHIKAGSFQFSEEMIESLFGYSSNDKKKNEGKTDLASKDAPQFVKILEPKKAQNLAISLKALSVSAEEVCSAVMEGNELPAELIQTLLRWIPTNDEELRLRLYTGELCQLGPAEQFLRAIIDIPYVFQRLDALLFMATLPEEAANAKQSFSTLEVACQELRNSRLFLKLLEAVLKTGNRMNDGTFRGGAQAFKLDTLLKLADVKGTDGKTTLLHFVVQEIIRSEGVRAVRIARENTSSGMSSVNPEDLTEDPNHETEDDYKKLGLKVVSSLGDELQNVRKAAGLDADALTISVASLGHKLVKMNDFLNTAMKSMDEESGFHHKLRDFIEHSQADITSLLEEEKRIRFLVRSTVDYFHGSTGKDEGLRLFVVVRDFIGILDKTCKEVKEASKAVARKPKTRQPSQSSLSFRDPRQHLFPAIQDRRADSSSSSDEES